ncbi:MAG: enolase C-terminal domain-like protein [Candidatus Omnitrophica bacterium]|nr:enolase C-terminal domain-like protein [Candidatus Omnitrophota bacterium]
MRLRKITIHHIRLPFRMRFKHALASHSEAHNIVIACELEDGTIGYGESIPRGYVTGESVNSVFDLFRHIRPSSFKKDISSPEQLFSELSGHLFPTQGEWGLQAARCALELALIDAYGKSFNVSASAVLEPLRIEGATVSSPGVSGVIGEGGLFRNKLRARAMKLYGLPAIKLKVGRGERDTVRTVSRIRRVLGANYDLRIDVNGVWTYSEAVSIVKALEPYGLSAIEEPLREEDKHRLSELRRFTSVPIILDESFCSKGDLEWILNKRTADGINIRISKCGGLVPSLEMAALARKNGLIVQLGSHVGEDSILGAAARHFLAIFPNVRFLETSYGFVLLKRSIVRERLCFGYGGRLAGKLKPSGLGVRVDEKRLKHYSERAFEIRL